MFCFFQNAFLLLCFMASVMAVLEVSEAGKRICTGFFCMDDHFFNHLGPFFQQTSPPRPTIEEKEDTSTTENPLPHFRQPILPKAVNNPVTWSPSTVDLLDENDGIYEGDYSYYLDSEDHVFDDYEWQPYQPTDQVVNNEVDVLTAPFNGSTTKELNSEAKNEKLPFLDTYYDEDLLIAKNENFDYEVETHSNTRDNACPCRCVCADVPLF